MCAQPDAIREVKFWNGGWIVCNPMIVRGAQSADRIVDSLNRDLSCRESTGDQQPQGMIARIASSTHCTAPPTTSW